MARIVVFGAAGYTGRLTVEALTAAGQRPVLAGRGRERLAALADQHGGLEAAVADATDPASVRALVEPGDVLVSTVGPFTRYGEPAVAAAAGMGVHYVDSTGEAPFIRRVFAEFGPKAERSGAALLTAFGYDFVPGNLAGGLAIQDARNAAGGAADGAADGAGAVPRRVEIGYFLTGDTSASGMSSGTRATIATGPGQRQHVWRDGRLVTEPIARRVRRFADDGRQLPAVSFGGSEQLALPRWAPQLREVDVYLGWFGRRSRALQLASLLEPVALALPGARRRLQQRGERALGRTGQGPDAAARARTGALVIAVARDAAGRELARVRLAGGNGYDLTGQLLAFAATRLAAGEVNGAGALGPVDAFGLEVLEAACRDAGLRRTA
ncbi:MAG TPA: saccharopine dehydrogenase NADP-binding domain-containing protein [Actinomycetota bacterium]